MNPCQTAPFCIALPKFWCVGADILDLKMAYKKDIS